VRQQQAIQVMFSLFARPFESAASAYTLLRATCDFAAVHTSNPLYVTRVTAL